MPWKTAGELLQDFRIGQFGLVFGVVKHDLGGS
jgi:hypothetical protein